VRLCESLIQEGQDVTLVALDWGAMDSQPPFLKTFPLGIGPRRLGRSPTMKRWLDEQVLSNKVEVLHTHGMWQMNVVYPGWAANKRKIIFVVSPRGMLSERAIQSGSTIKRIFWPLLQRPVLASATCFHATAESEFEDIRRMGFRQPVAVIPNGIDIPDLPLKQCGGFRSLLFLGRIHPIKGLDMLLPAWRAVQDRFPEWRLVIAGSDDGYYGKSGYLDELRKLAQELGVRRIDFVGQLQGLRKLRAYRDADLFVLPSYSENFGMTVAEALAAGTPAIVTQGAPWEGLNLHDAGWWIEVGKDSLVACFENALARPHDTLAEMGLHGRNWMQRDFSWPYVAQRMVETYEWLAGDRSTVPVCVRAD
jgi:glycosyltransferase involved in cell wall biosynthesis